MVLEVKSTARDARATSVSVREASTRLMDSWIVRLFSGKKKKE
jgi:hypothetical protein